jgi:hypothetical protein
MSAGSGYMKAGDNFEMEFIREFSVGGELLSGTGEHRREQIRIAIYRGNLQHAPFRDSGLDYAEAYEQCFRRPIERRQSIRE